MDSGQGLKKVCFSEEDEFEIRDPVSKREMGDCQILRSERHLYKMNSSKRAYYCTPYPGEIDGYRVKQDTCREVNRFQQDIDWQLKTFLVWPP